MTFVYANAKYFQVARLAAEWASGITGLMPGSESLYSVLVHEIGPKRADTRENGVNTGFGSLIHTEVLDW